MPTMTSVKSFFKTELSDILKPLEEIHNKLTKFMDNVALEISDEVKKIADSQLVIEAKKVEQETANKVRDNLKNLLGKL